MPDWLDALAAEAPIAVGAFRSFTADQPLAVRRAVRRAAGPDSAGRSTAELAATAEAIATLVETLAEGAFAEPGGEEDWNVGQTLGHTATARAGLVLAASLAAGGRWPADAPTVVPGIPGPSGEARDALAARIRKSQRVIERAAPAVAGHEGDPCPLDHPLVGHLRCGEWLVFAAVHDLMHLDQLHALQRRLAGEP